MSDHDALLPRGSACQADLECQSGHCACAVFSLAGRCGPVAEHFRCASTEDCEAGLECVQHPPVTALFPQEWCKGTCTKR